MRPRLVEDIPWSLEQLLEYCPELLAKCELWWAVGDMVSNPEKVRHGNRM
jgi:hypothetical protein